MNRIKEYRRKRGLTQVELAQACGLSQAALSGYETGRYEPDMYTMRRLASFFDVTLDELFGIDYTETDKELSEIEYALYGEIKNLSDDAKQDVLDYVRFKRSQRKKIQ